MVIQRIALFCLVFLTSCVNQQKQIITDFPIKPELKIYTNSPVIKKIDENFLVTSELIYNSTMLKDYYKRIDSWKEKNRVP